MSAHSHLTDCGLPGILKIPYGLHACHFYPNRAELIDALVPFFLAGLYNREKCLWITAPPLPAAEGRAALRQAWSGVDKASAQGALRVVDFNDWYGNNEVDPTRVVEAWLKEEEQAVAEGYRGLRLTGNTSFVTPQDWPMFMEYERKVGAAFSKRRIIALCSYHLGSCSGAQATEALSHHDCSFHRADAGWEVLSRERKGP